MRDAVREAVRDAVRGVIGARIHSKTMPRCKVCSQVLNTASFSRTQQRKPVNARTCKVCLDKQRAEQEEVKRERQEEEDYRQWAYEQFVYHGIDMYDV